MASAPQLPLFYKGLEPLSSETHKDYKLKAQETAPFLADQHAIPITVEEFPWSSATCRSSSRSARTRSRWR